LFTKLYTPRPKQITVNPAHLSLINFGEGVEFDRRVLGGNVNKNLAQLKNGTYMAIENAVDDPSNRLKIMDVTDQEAEKEAKVEQKSEEPMVKVPDAIGVAATEPPKAQPPAVVEEESPAEAKTAPSSPAPVEKPSKKAKHMPVEAEEKDEKEEEEEEPKHSEKKSSNKNKHSSKTKHSSKAKVVEDDDDDDSIIGRF
jgi:hypothetical protein